MANDSLISKTDLSQAVSVINPLIVKIIDAVVILLIGFVIGKIAEKLSLKIFEMIELEKYTKKLKIKKLSRILSKILSFVAYIIAIVLALNKLELTTAIISTVVILLIIVLALFFLFGINDMIANLFAGMMIRIKKNISVGDTIMIKNAKRSIKGTVEQISLLNFRINTGKEELVIIPNTLLLRSTITKIRNH